MLGEDLECYDACTDALMVFRRSGIHEKCDMELTSKTKLFVSFHISESKWLVEPEVLGCMHCWCFKGMKLLKCEIWGLTYTT